MTANGPRSRLVPCKICNIETEKRSQILPIASLATTMPSSSLDAYGSGEKSRPVARACSSRGHRRVQKARDEMIHGLPLAIPGEEVRRLLERRMENHRQRADWWKREQARTPEEQTEDHSCQSTSARTKQSVTNGVRRVWDSFAIASNLPRSIDWPKQIYTSASRCRKSLDGWSRRNTKSTPAWDSIWNGSRGRLEKHCRENWRSPRGKLSAISDSENRDRQPLNWRTAFAPRGPKGTDDFARAVL